MTGEQVLHGVLDYIEAEVLPDTPRFARFFLRLVIRFARDWQTIRGYIDKAGEKLVASPGRKKREKEPLSAAKNA